MNDLLQLPVAHCVGRTAADNDGDKSRGRVGGRWSERGRAEGRCMKRAGRKGEYLFLVALILDLLCLHASISEAECGAWDEALCVCAISMSL